jgi:hypothetical protein
MASHRSSNDGFTPFGRLFLAILVLLVAAPILLSVTVGPPVSTVAWVMLGVVGLILFGLPNRRR